MLRTGYSYVNVSEVPPVDEFEDEPTHPDLLAAAPMAAIVFGIRYETRTDAQLVAGVAL